MEAPPGGRCSELGEDISIILITGAQLIFFTFYHRFISWPVTGPEGVTRLSLLTSDYFTWLPFVIAASIIVIVASLVMIVYRGYWFRQAAWVVFCIIGITVVVSLVTIFPFDFSVIPNARVANAAPTVVTVVLVLAAVFYGITGLALFLRLRRDMTKQETG